MHFVNHDQYKHSLINFDVSVLFLQSELQNTSFVRPICLTRAETSDAVTVLGWGLDNDSTHSMELKKSLQQILSPQRCETALGPALWRKDGFGDDLFCVADPTGAESGSCFGDSGGPIFMLNSVKGLRYELRGLVNGGKRCGIFNTPDIYTSTTYPEIYDWIRENIECSAGEHCVPRNDCPHVQSKYQVYEDKTTQSALKAVTRQQLRSLVCDTEERLFCCEDQSKSQYLMQPQSVICFYLKYTFMSHL